MLQSAKDIERICLYQIITILQSSMEQHEPLGTKRKDWFDNNTKLFKVGREGTLENCSEKIAYEIAKLIDLPCAKYEFGKLIKDDGTQILGIISENFLLDENGEKTLMLGNEFICNNENSYDKNTKYNHKEYELQKVLKLFLQSPQIKGYDNFSSLSVMIGYLLFDCLIGNTDRHHENWGIVFNGEVKIAPTFDHASGLASKISPENASKRLASKDKGQSVEHFCQRAESAFYQGGKKLKTFEVCQNIRDFCLSHSQNTFWDFQKWIERFCSLDQDKYQKILDNIPEEILLSQSQKEFILKVLDFNTQRLKELGREK